MMRRIFPGGIVAVFLLAAGCGTDQGTGLKYTE
jgi:hypothetical protein